MTVRDLPGNCLKMGNITLASATGKCDAYLCVPASQPAAASEDTFGMASSGSSSVGWVWGRPLGISNFFVASERESPNCTV